MSIDRRRMLALLGGGVVAAANLAAARAVLAAAPDPAIAPWFAAGSPEPDPRRAAVAYAILAPNPHNRQPWLVRLDGTDGLTLLCDLGRRLPETDPFDRQIVIGLGAFTELLVMAAAQQGFRADVTAFPDGEPAADGRLDARPVAQVRLVPGATSSDPLFAHVLERRSNKAPYDMARTVSAGDAAAIAAAAVHGSRVTPVLDAAAVARVRDVSERAFVAEIETPATALESVRLLRIGQAEVAATPDGIDLTGPMIEDLREKGILTHEAVAAEVGGGTDGPIKRQMIDYGVAPMRATPAYLWQSTTGNGRALQLAAGRDYVRLNLAATARGLAMHPQSNALQEFPAMRELAASMRRTLDVPDGETLQMLSRLGTGPAVAPSPRWPAATRVVAD